VQEQPFNSVFSQSIASCSYFHLPQANKKQDQSSWYQNILKKKKKEKKKEEA
jgi:hypothetical protein